MKKSELEYMGILEGFLEFQPEDELIIQTVSIHILYSIHNDKLTAQCLDYNEKSKIPLPEFVKYITGKNENSAVSGIIAAATGEIIINVLNLLELNIDDETDYYSFQTEGDLWDIFRNYMRIYNDFQFKGKYTIAGNIQNPYLNMNDIILKEMKRDLLSEDIIKRLNARLLDITISLKKELKEIIRELFV